MKKSIVLLISLLFITAISALLLQNLDDTQSYVESQNYKINKVQLLALTKNMQKEASRFIKDYPDDLKNLENALFKVNENIVQFNFKDYDKADIHAIHTPNTDKYKNIESIFFNNGVSDFESLAYVFPKDKKVNNYKQLDDIIDNFIRQTYNKDILKIKDKLGFLTLGESDKFYELNVTVKNINDFVNAYYVLDKSGGVKYFELGFK